MAFCIGEILECFVNCSTCITACPIEGIIKPLRMTTYTTFLQPCVDRKAVFPLSVAAGRGMRCVRRNAPRARSCAGENARDVGSSMIDREIKCKAELTKSDLACSRRTRATTAPRRVFLDHLVIEEITRTSVEWREKERNITRDFASRRHSLGR